MTDPLPGALVTTNWLEAALGAPDLKIVDCTWHHASTNLDGRTQYRGRHLPGAVHFDIDHVADPKSELPHMLPSAADFAKKMGLLGIADGDRVVVYDRNCGGSAAARAWWMFRVFGHGNVAMLDGGYGKWTKEKRASEMSPVRPEPKSFTASFTPGLVRTLDEMKANLQSGAAQVIDARGPAKFDGTQEDVFAFKKQGHMPGAINIPWGDLIEPESGSMIAPETVKARFEAADIDLSRPIVATCASGITSCMIALALFVIGHKDAAVFDGAWAEWSLADDLPAEAA